MFQKSHCTAEYRETPIKAQSKESHQPPVYLETGGRFNLRSQAAQFNAKVGGLHLMNPAFKTQDEQPEGGKLRFNNRSAFFHISSADWTMCVQHSYGVSVKAQDTVTVQDFDFPVR